MQKFIRIGIALGMLVGLSTGCATESPEAEDRPAALPEIPSERAVSLLAVYRERFQVDVAATLPPAYARLAPNAKAEPFVPLASPYDVTFNRDGDVLRASFRDADMPEHELEVAVPALLGAGHRLRDLDSGVAITAEMLDAEAVPAGVADGQVIFEDALEGATVIHRPTPAGLEDFVVFESRPSEERIRYRVHLEGATAGLRLVENTLEFLDAEGMPRLRVAPPYVIPEGGPLVWAQLHISGCEVDRNPVPPWERPVVDPRQTSCDVEVDWSGLDVAYPLLVDPSWAATTNLITARAGHVSTRLSGGNVIIVGGQGPGGTALSSAEIMNKTTFVWTPTGSMASARYGMAGGNFGGAPLVAGGGGGLCGAVCSSAEIYSNSTGLWSSAGSMGTARLAGSYSFFSSGFSIYALVSGGLDSSSNALQTAEYYNSGVWTPVSNSMSVPRYLHTSTTVFPPNPNVVVVANGDTGPASTPSVDRYDAPPINAFTPAAAGALDRFGQGAAQIPGTDQVLIYGGILAATGTCTRLAQIYDVSANTWTSAASAPMSLCYPSATSIGTSGGNVLVAAGLASSANPSNAQALYSAALNLWSVPSPGLTNARYAGSAVLFDPGGVDKVLMTGGMNPMGTPIVSAEIFTP